ncbi:unnamed protein product [Darwinula stevensoni]|uniref:Integrase catalytic domain-containing protein n=1 Tax=Darwinula stevensoni TaxID=69355 RepID=A0A7R9AHR7_9CRUS|nr:unnamed protein product [Darwinula stevensoni]CAG0905589.1 unnamed protein product [Darwinula stevensoni]
MCAALDVSIAGYHAWTKCTQYLSNVQAAQHTSKHVGDIAQAAREEHTKGRGVYGAKRLYTRLCQRGFSLSLSGVKRLRRKLGLVQHHKKRWVCTTDSKHNLAVAPNLLEQRFNTCTAPNQVWVADITYIDTDEGWLYLAGVKDLYTKKLVGWAMAQHMEASLVAQAVHMAIKRNAPGTGLIAHSDRGSQYASDKYRRVLAQHSMRQSMSRRGNCYDNAPMESFWASLKKECVHGKRYQTRTQARADIFDYIETFYNTTRLHSALAMSPLEFEAQYWSGFAKHTEQARTDPRGQAWGRPSPCTPFFI